MVRTGARAAALRTLLSAAGMEFVDGARPLRMGALPAEAQDEVRRLYEQLGGCRRDVRFAPAGWDLVMKDGLAVELDEQFHFTGIER